MLMYVKKKSRFVETWISYQIVEYFKRCDRLKTSFASFLSNFREAITIGRCEKDCDAKAKK